MTAAELEIWARTAALMAVVFAGYALLRWWVRRDRTYLVAPDDLASQCAPDTVVDPLAEHAREALIPTAADRQDRGEHVEQILAEGLDAEGFDWHLARAVALRCRYVLESEGVLDPYYARPLSTYTPEGR